MTNGASADLVLLFARTDTPDDRRGSHGIGAFLVPTDAPGYCPGKKERKMGIRGSETVEVSLNDLRLGPEHLIGEPNRGFRYALAALEGGRLGIAAQAVGIARAAYEAALGYAKGRVQFGQPIASFQAIQFMLADMATTIDAARLLAYRAAILRDQGIQYGLEASMAKLYASEVAMCVTTKAIQIYGGYGYITDYPVQRYFRDAKVTEIYEGTSEIQRLVIAGHLVG